MGAVTSAIAKREESVALAVSPRQAIVNILEDNRGAISASLPTGYTAERFTRLLVTAGNTNPKLFECTPRSFLAAGIVAAQLGLEPNDPRGLSYLIPYRNKKTGRTEVKIIIGYRGMMELARRSTLVGAMHAVAVYAGDQFDYSLGLEPTLHHVPADGDENPKDLTHVYAVAKVNGEPQFVVLTRRQVEKARARSESGDSSYSPWATDYAEMAKKTALRRLCKYLPQTVEIATALAQEEQSLTLSDIGAITAEPDDHDDALDAQIIEPEAIEA